MSPTTIFSHIGSVKQSDGVLRIDIKTMQAVIARSDVSQLLDHYPVDVYNMADIIQTCGSPEKVGRAWMARSGKSVVFHINGFRYVSPLAQVKGLLNGTRKYAHVAIMLEKEAPAADAPSSCPAGMTAEASA
ncbi:hypothetical protein J2741_001709 [Methanolinea mesophila]|uniref:hypothetical protein n=1 Tax=Methanolinea mesophila TaxID=547055 RepID=UPI001AE4069D|nr:hypothetical protein [Methanolinea mesophila]MBP1929162.1 hypothetical protein [Methanolinea mesophila]